jgi:abequosyltransferase
MKKPLLSICIPTYNREKYLKSAIESVLSQADEKNRNLIEICISDNCSKDNTEKLVKTFAKTAPPRTNKIQQKFKKFGSRYEFS